MSVSSFNTRNAAAEQKLSHWFAAKKFWSKCCESVCVVVIGMRLFNPNRTTQNANEETN